MCILCMTVMAIAGVVILFNGNIRLSQRKVVKGPSARLIGVVFLCPFPLAYGLTLLLESRSAHEGESLEPFPESTLVWMVQIACVLGCAALAGVIGMFTAQELPPQPLQQDG